MAYTSLPKLVPIGSPRISAQEITRNMITEVLQSAPMKRLLSKPNIIIKAVSFASPGASAIPLSTNIDSSYVRKPVSTETLVESQLIDDDNLLPSKHKGKSEITLVPLKRVRKSCGHYEPCENIICDVNIQPYVDYASSSSTFSKDINNAELGAPVLKHCDNSRCDALSIDHNRCRRAVVRLCRYDKSNICDICGMSLKTRKTRLNHRNCKRPGNYRHNQMDGAQVLRERMRERELEMMEALRIKRTVHSDSITAEERAIETLKNNSELIVIPKILTSVPEQQLYQQKSIIAIKTVPSSITPRVLPSHECLQQNVVLNTLPPEAMTPESSGISSMSGDSKFIVTTMPQASTISYPLKLNDWVMTQPRENMQRQKPLLMPVRVVPISHLKSEPSLLHQKQGIPKFCIIADNSIPVRSYINLQTISNMQSVSKSINLIQEIEPTLSKPQSANIKLKLSSQRHFRREKKIDKKPFECTYCSKRFLTDWYFKMHVAKHKGEVKDTCDESFTSDCDLECHVSKERDKNALTMENETKDKMMVEQEDFSFVCDNCQCAFDSDFEIQTHKCNRLKDILDDKSKNKNLNGDEDNNEEIEKENGIIKGKLVIGLTNKNSKIEEHQSIMKKHMTRRNIRHSNTTEHLDYLDEELKL